jgi:NAD+ diphosphatase
MVNFNVSDFSKLQPNFFGSDNLDRMTDNRNDLNWFEKLNKKNVKIVPVWNSSILFERAIKSQEDFTSILFPNLYDIEEFIENQNLKILLGSRNKSTVNEIFLCIDFSNSTQKKINSIMQSFGEFRSLRDASPKLDKFKGSLAAYAIAISNWHKQNKFCNTCGAKTLVSNAGHQINCSQKHCAYIQFPRMDPAVIMLIYNNNKTLLGRQTIWPKGMYSTLAGFVEPGETLENAVAREVYEEAGIKVHKIKYHSSQPWPFPSSLMLGFFAEAKSTKIKINKSEIEDVRWFSKEELLNFHDQNKFLPRKISIARRLIDDWLNEK